MCIRDSYATGCGGRGLYITRSCKDVEAAYKLLAYAYGEEGMKLLMWGIEGEDLSLIHIFLISADNNKIA